jgi:hypothetical protein
MKKLKTFVLTGVSFTLLVMVLIAIFLKYPLNLIVDAIFLAIIGFLTLLYIIVWSLLKDSVVVSRDNISVMSHRFLLWKIHEDRIFFGEMAYFVKDGSDTIISTRKGRIITIIDPIDEMGDEIDDLPGILARKRVPRESYEDHIKGRIRKRESYLGKI